MSGVSSPRLDPEGVRVMSEQEMPESARHLRESERAEAADLTPRPPRSALTPASRGDAPLLAPSGARAVVPPRGDGETTTSVPPRPTFLRSFVYAWRGIVYAVRTQRNMRVHIALAVVAIALGVALRISPVEFAMIFVAITGVFIAEMVNTVAEACVDLATQTYHPLARVAKDVAAGAVLVSAILAVVIALFVYAPHIVSLLR